MLCDCCGTRPVTRVLTHVIDGKKQTLYRCDTCAESQPEAKRPQLVRPCDQCGEREGRIKLTRLREQYREVLYLCEACAGKR